MNDIQLELFQIHKYSIRTLRDHQKHPDLYGVAAHFITHSNYNESYWKAYVLRRDNGVCVICGEEAEQVHHKKPKWDGGDNHPNNLVSLCLECHLYAPDDYSEWEAYVDAKRHERVMEYIDRRHLF